MNDTPAGDDATLSLHSLERIDKLCLTFEDAWQSGQHPRAEQYCAETPQSERSALLGQLLPLELEYRQQSGETPTREEYLARFPDHGALIDKVFRQASPPAVAPSPGAKVRYFGDYELLEEYRGGMGVVYKARQMSLNRIVALKMILAGELASENDVRRFHTEAAAAANLDHPGIVPIYEVGEQQGQHFFSMGFIEGESLAARVARGPLAPREAAEILRAVAEAVQYAHEKGVIHRDLKPANILLDFASHPRITDFGLARRVTGDSNLTASGQVLGTPSYMPPEQAGGKLHEIGPVSDVYALGAVLYTLLTRRPPFQAATPLETLSQVLKQEPVLPRRLDTHVPRDLETICLKAMDKNPAKRYRAAGQMAADLDRFLKGLPVLARRVGPVGRMIRWVKRSRAVAASLSSVAVLGLVAGLLAYHSYRASEDKKLAEERLAQEEAHALEAKKLADEQLAKEKRQHAIDAALVAAWSGDFDEAENEIAEAQRWNASRGRVLMLCGQVALHRNDTQKAVSYLEKAKALQPDSVAVQAMFAVACWQNGQWENFVKTMEGLDELTPVTPEDYLFKGYAEAALDPGDKSGLDSIDEAIQRRSNWTIAYALRAEARGWAALDKTDTKEIEGALADARMVKQLLPKRPIGPLVSLNVNLLAATIYAKEPDKRKEVLNEAENDFLCLESFPLSGWSVFMRYRYLEYIGRYDQARQEADRARGKVKGAWPATLYALSLYRDGECDEALKVLDHLKEDDKGAFQQTTRMFILAELSDGPKRAMDAYKELQKKLQDLGRSQETPPFYQQALLYLLGQKEKAIAEYLAMKLSKALKEVRRGSYASLLNYNCGEIIADDVLKAVPNSRYHECNACFFIGMSLLADGDRDGAREQFEKCVATGCFDFDASDWSRIFLERMKQDPNWPHWIPPKKQAAPRSPPRESTERSRTDEPAKP